MAPQFLYVYRYLLSSCHLTISLTLQLSMSRLASSDKKSVSCLAHELITNSRLADNCFQYKCITKTKEATDTRRYLSKFRTHTYNILMGRKTRPTTLADSEQRTQVSPLNQDLHSLIHLFLSVAQHSGNMSEIPSISCLHSEE